MECRLPLSMAPSTTGRQEENRRKFDPQSGVDHKGKGHYPHCLVTSTYDVFRCIPVTRTVVSIHGSEREETMSLVASIRPKAVLSL